MTLREAVKKYGKAHYETIRNRIDKGWALKKAFLTPGRVRVAA